MAMPLDLITVKMVKVMIENLIQPRHRTILNKQLPRQIRHSTLAPRPYMPISAEALLFLADSFF
jgi:hypothetical protein